MKTLILVAALSVGGFAVVGPLVLEHVPATAEDVDAHFADHAQHDDIDLEGGVLAIEVAEGTTFVVPAYDHEDQVTLLSLLAGNEQVEHRDIAGVYRTPAGRPVDARPGSMEAAQTGMQHDLGSATVTNTVSTDPTPSAVIQEVLGDEPGLREQPAPTAAEPLEGGGSGTKQA